MNVPSASLGDLPDVNVWIALTATHHEHHAIARAYWTDQAARAVWFCRFTQIGMTRLLGQSRVMGAANARTPRQAWDTAQVLLAQPGVGLCAEPAGVDSEIDRLSRSGTWSGPHWTDAYLAAFAIAGNLRIISFDRDFARFPDLHWLHLTPTPSEAA